MLTIPLKQNTRDIVFFLLVGDVALWKITYFEGMAFIYLYFESLYLY